MSFLASFRRQKITNLALLAARERYQRQGQTRTFHPSLVVGSVEGARLPFDTKLAMSHAEAAVNELIDSGRYA